MPNAIDALKDLPKESLEGLAALTSKKKPIESPIAIRYRDELTTHARELYSKLTEERLIEFDEMNEYLRLKYVLGGCGLPRRNGCTVIVERNDICYTFGYCDDKGILMTTSHTPGVCTIHIETEAQYANTPVEELKVAFAKKLELTLEEGKRKVDKMIEDTHQTPGWTKGTTFEY